MSIARGLATSALALALAALIRVATYVGSDRG